MFYHRQRFNNLKHQMNKFFKIKGLVHCFFSTINRVGTKFASKEIRF